ncbi:hypothetical protein CB0940_11884 [Cercospora beticola]|uniref:Extracellular membrane protein CFEM domain-containing protein n=1 Tax=Cercospora beticola TaxID=122368 RepID=A0A2G5IF79_CERBT|nr:hypothetical protein CB0940_11884 [Cercospora beticola]PIB03123.1 hypothetical protein CB0940_11884 [Cercospora beticola]WPB04244.1 hypothetical protein RHO25_008889 [Cercospora beticola]CAK1356944.1 unnamed protein product [Cercospora beticola]
MQFKYLAALLASTAVSGVIAGPEPVINARALEAREEQAEQAAQMQQMQQAQQAQQAKQVAQLQQVNQGAQMQQANQGAQAQQAGQAAQVQQNSNAPAADPPKAAPADSKSSSGGGFFGDLSGFMPKDITVYNYPGYNGLNPYGPYPPNRFGPHYPDFPVIDPVYNFCPSFLQCNNNFDCVSFTVQTDFYGFNTCLTANSYQRCSCTYPLPPAFGPYGPYY